MKPHLSLSLSRELWRELLSASLPIEVTSEAFDLTRDTRRAIRQLGVRRRVAGLLETGAPVPGVSAARRRLRGAWTRARPLVVQRVHELVRVRGTWRFEIDSMGTDLRYGRQRVQAEATMKGIAEGTVWLLRENVEIPFVIERRMGASVELADIRYDPSHKAVIGSLRDLGVYVGDNIALQLVARLLEFGLEQQLPRVNPLPILRLDQVESMVGPMGGPLKMQMGVEDLALDIDEHEMTLKVRFGFTRGQIEENEAP
jgi:hypothetical protein